MSGEGPQRAADDKRDRANDPRRRARKVIEQALERRRPWHHGATSGGRERSGRPRDEEGSNADCQSGAPSDHARESGNRPHIEALNGVAWCEPGRCNCARPRAMLSKLGEYVGSVSSDTPWLCSSSHTPRLRSAFCVAALANTLESRRADLQVDIARDALLSIRKGTAPDNRSMLTSLVCVCGGKKSAGSMA